MADGFIDIKLVLVQNDAIPLGAVVRFEDESPWKRCEIRRPDSVVRAKQRDQVLRANSFSDIVAAIAGA
jgi:hypothetical protein